MKLMCSLAVVAAGLTFSAGCQGGNDGTPGVDRTDSRAANQVPAGRNGAGDSAGQVISPQERERVDRIRNGQYETRPRDAGAGVNATDSRTAPRDNVSGVGGGGVGNSSADPRGTNAGSSGTNTTPDRTAPAGR